MDTTASAASVQSPRPNHSPEKRPCLFSRYKFHLICVPCSFGRSLRMHRRIRTRTEYRTYGALHEVRTYTQQRTMGKRASAFHPHSLLPLLDHSMQVLASPCPCPCAQHTMCLTFCNPSVGTHSHPPTALSVPRKSPLQFAFVPAPALPNEPTQHHQPQPSLPLRALHSVE